MTTTVEVNDEVHALGQKGRFVVVSLKRASAVIQLYGDDTRNGERVYFEDTIEVPLGALTVTAKGHQRPASFKMVR
jgi:hypothetical protein